MASEGGEEETVPSAQAMGYATGKEVTGTGTERKSGGAPVASTGALEYSCWVCKVLLHRHVIYGARMREPRAGCELSHKKNTYDSRASSARARATFL